MSFFERFLRGMGLNVSESENPFIVSLRRFSEQLTDVASTLRVTSLRAVTLEQRVSELAGDAAAWERRVSRAARMGNAELMVSAARMAGRVGGELAAARSELVGCLENEIKFRDALTKERRKWFRMVEDAKRMGLDVSSCLLEIDLSRPTAPVDMGPEDEERDFVARVIDGARLN